MWTTTGGDPPTQATSVPPYWREKLAVQDLEWRRKWQDRSDDLRDFGLDPTEADHAAYREVFAEIQVIDEADWARQIAEDPTLRAAVAAHQARRRTELSAQTSDIHAFTEGGCP